MPTIIIYFYLTFEMPSVQSQDQILQRLDREQFYQFVYVKWLPYFQIKYIVD